jgi:hypothetical protein
MNPPPTIASDIDTLDGAPTDDLVAADRLTNDVDARRKHDRSAAFARHGLSTRDVLVLALAAIWCVAYGPFFVVTSWTPRVLLMLAALPAGTLVMFDLARRHDRAARWALASLATAVVSAVLSADPRASLVGFYGMETSVAVTLGAFAMWALGRATSAPSRRLLPGVLASALGVNALVGVLQVVLRIDSGDLGVEPGRASGLTPNAVYFGALMAGAAVMCAAQALGRAHRRLWLVGVVAFAMASTLSGGRIALGALIAGTAYVVIRHARDARARLGVGASAVLGGALGTIIVRLMQTTSVTERVTDSGLTGRAEAWRFGLQAFAERPVFGWGLGRYRAAAQSHFDVAFVRRYAPNELSQAWFDPHNVLVNLLVGVGAVGLIVFLGFAISILRTSRGPLAVGAGVIALSWLVQPAALATFPLALLMLGAASTVEVEAPAGTRFRRFVVVALAMSFVAWIGGVDLAVRHAADQGDVVDAEAALEWMPGDPVLSHLVAQLWMYEALDDPAAGPQAIEWSKKVVDSQPDRPYWWSRLATRQLLLGDSDDAKSSLDRALELSPWNADAWTVMLAYAQTVNDAGLEQRASEVVCLLELDACPD